MLWVWDIVSSLQENLDDDESITKKEIHLLVVLSGPKSRLMAWNRMARFLEHRILILLSK